MRPATFRPRGPKRFAHQIQGLKDTIANRGVHALLFDPGTGKTAVAIDYASLLALKSPTGRARVLVLAPVAALDSWIGQAEVFAAEGVALHAEALGGSLIQRAATLRARGEGDYSTGALKALDLRRIEDGDVHLTLLAMNYDSFASRAKMKGSARTVAQHMADAVAAFKPDLIVCDESHRLKSPTSNTSKALAKVGELARRRMILTGTVMPHSPLDVFGQWRFLDPYAFAAEPPRGGVRKPAHYTGFRSRFAVMGGWMGKQVVGYQNLDVMREVMARNSTVATKDDVLDLPAVTDVTVPVTLSSAERRAYAAMKNELVARFESGDLASVPNRLAQMMRLRQITSGFLPTDDGELQAVGTSKVDTIAGIASETLAGERRVVIFSHFLPEIELVKNALAKDSGTVLTITGATAPADRKAIRERFGNRETTERLILVCQTRTMSLAVNELVTASHAIFGSLSERRDDTEQARARLDRQGQTRPVTMWTVVAPQTVDEVLLTSYRDRTDLETAMLHHLKGEQ